MDKEIRKKLKSRAIHMAKEPEQRRDISMKTDVVVFSLASENYAIESSFVREVYPLKDYTELPGSPAFIFGIINLRGQIIPVVDLKKFFNLPEKGLGDLNRVIILHNELIEFGILADLVQGTQPVDPEDILPSPSAVSGIGEEYLKGVTKERLIVLDAEKLLSDKRIIVNQEVE
jgi:purine-binding chemotaxis protein CheW